MDPKQPPISAETLFRSESDWPFVLRCQKLEECLSFYRDQQNSSLGIVRLTGVSGTGKSFFVRELLNRFAEENQENLVIYVDVPIADIDATNLNMQLEKLLSTERVANRNKPIQIPRNVARQWASRKKIPSFLKGSYVYRVTRDLVGQIPVAGPFLKAIMPTTISHEVLNGGSPMAALRHVLAISNKSNVLLALDNIQNIPSLLREMIDDEFTLHGAKTGLVIVERLNDRQEINWLPALMERSVLDVEMGFVGVMEIEDILCKVLPLHPDRKKLAETLHRRSEGNLKSIWFQLKLITQREQSVNSYEGVVQSLRPKDQAVLRLVVFLLGGLSIAHLTRIFAATDIGVNPESVAAAIGDLTALGLLVVNSDSNDRVRVEHEIVSNIVSDLTPEEEKLDLRVQLVVALDRLLNESGIANNDAALYDRLLGISDELEVRGSPSLQSHIVRFINDQHQEERFTYLATILRDSVCWDIIDILPNHTIKALLNAIQKCSLFSFGLIATERLKSSSAHEQLAHLYEAKYLVQLFRYDDASHALEKVVDSRERDLVYFNILLNLCSNEEALQIAENVYSESTTSNLSEFECAILRNSGHLFSNTDAHVILTVAVEGFARLGTTHGFATALNNLAIAEIVANKHKAARKNLLKAESILSKLASAEVYQPIVNLAAISLASNEFQSARDWLQLARESVPRTLSMDALMLDHNELVVELVENKNMNMEIYEQFKSLHDAARRTRDVRFTETIGWFVSQLQAALSIDRDVQYSHIVVHAVLDPDLSGMEIIIPLQLRKIFVETPFFLSPHWRY